MVYSIKIIPSLITLDLVDIKPLGQGIPGGGGGLQVGGYWGLELVNWLRGAIACRRLLMPWLVKHEPSGQLRGGILKSVGGGCLAKLGQAVG